jgi:hypothetical protein
MTADSGKRGNELGPIGLAVAAILQSFGYRSLFNRTGTSCLFDCQTEGALW